MGASTETPSTLCGCDGNIYDFWFEHELAGVDAGDLELCEAPAGKFHCGGTLCDDDGMTYCVNPGIDCSAGPSSCEALPANCVDSTDCNCFGAEIIGCGLRSDGIFELSCAP